MRLPLLSVLTFVWVWALASADILSGLPDAQNVFALASDYGLSAWNKGIDSCEDAWEFVTKQSDQAMTYTHAAFEENKQKFKDVAVKLDELKEGMYALADRAREVKLLLDHYKIDHQALIDQLNDAGSKAVDTLQKEFNKPLPEDLEERSRYRAEMVASILSQMEEPYVRFSEEHGMPKEKARSSYEYIRRALEKLFLIAAYIADRHPELVRMIVMSIVVTLLPAGSILSPFLGLFGFGPLGPIKGSLAAWLQSHFWGGFVAQSSWFAFMQRAGMTAGRPALVAMGRAAAAFFGF